MVNKPFPDNSEENFFAEEVRCLFEKFIEKSAPFLLHNLL